MLRLIIAAIPALVLVLQAAPAAAQPDRSGCSVAAAAGAAVCAHPVLAALEVELAGHLALLAEHAPEWARQEVRAEQAEWLGRRDACGADVACLQRQYRARLASIYTRLECLRTELPLDG